VVFPEDRPVGGISLARIRGVEGARLLAA
jgi:hypothetical protein